MQQNQIFEEIWFGLEAIWLLKLLQKMCKLFFIILY